MQIRQFVDEGLGNSAHLVISKRAGVAALIDPLRDVDRYLDAASAAGVRITHVFETHLHNDFVSGGREVAMLTGARICASGVADLQFEYQPLQDGDIVIVGDVRFTILATPGHTPEHLSYYAEDLTAPENPGALFSGGSLLVGAVSRTDLLGHEHAAGFARELYHSLHDKILRLPDEVVVYPTHGAGSFCTAAPGTARSTTIGQERRFNPLVQLESPETFVAQVLQSMPSYPAYFHHLRALNRGGARVLGGLPEPAPLPPLEVQTRMARGEAVVDLRPVAQYLEGHIPGVYHVELRPGFATWVGWVVPFASPLVFVTDGDGVPEEAVRELVRIGYDDLPGYLAGGMTAWERSGLPVAHLRAMTMHEVRTRLERGEPLVVLDVRQDTEWASGRIPQARHLEVGAVAARPGILPAEPGIVAYCGHGQRAATALSLLEQQGYTNLRLLEGGMTAWQAAGHPVERS